VSDLGRRASELVRAGREAGRPSEKDRERNLAALRARLAAASVPTEIAASRGAPRARRPLWTAAAVMGAVLGAGAALAVTMRQPRPPAAPIDSKPVAAQVEAASAPEETARAVPPIPSESPPPAVGAEPGSAAPHRPTRDRLAQEVAILSRAASSLEAGRASEALRAIDEHGRKFPNGVLKEERYAARVRAARELALLAELAPGSPQVARARQGCAAASRPPPR